MQRVVQITGHAKTKVHKKPYEFEDMQEMQKPGGKYKKRQLQQQLHPPIGESLRNIGWRV